MSQEVSDGIILFVIEKGLDALGETAKQSLWFYLERDFGFTRKNIPERIVAFQDALRGFFGVGYSFLDALFCRYLQEATGENLVGYSSFVECVNYLRAKKSILNPAFERIDLVK